MLESILLIYIYIGCKWNTNSKTQARNLCSRPNIIPRDYDYVCVAFVFSKTYSHKAIIIFLWGWLNAFCTLNWWNLFFAQPIGIIDQQICVVVALHSSFDIGAPKLRRENCRRNNVCIYIIHVYVYVGANGVEYEHTHKYMPLAYIEATRNLVRVFCASVFLKHCSRWNLLFHNSKKKIRH